MIDCLPGDAFGVFSCQFWNTVLQCGVLLPIHTLNYWTALISGACLLAGGVLNCNLSLRRSVAVLCMLDRIRCNPMHPHCGALPVPYVTVQVARGALIAHRYTYAPPRCRTSLYRMSFIPLSYLSGTIWLAPYSMVWDWRVSRVGPMPFCCPSCSLLFVFNYFPFLFFSSIGW